MFAHSLAFFEATLSYEYFLGESVLLAVQQKTFSGSWDLIEAVITLAYSWTGTEFFLLVNAFFSFPSCVLHPFQSPAYSRPLRWGKFPSISHFILRECA